MTTETSTVHPMVLAAAKGLCHEAALQLSMDEDGEALEWKVNSDYYTQRAQAALTACGALDCLEAVAPFANLLARHHARLDDETPVYGVCDNAITVGDIRRAVSAIAKAREVSSADKSQSDDHAALLPDRSIGPQGRGGVVAGMLICPECASVLVVVTAEQMFDANTGDHYCHSVKTQDPDAKAKCRSCQWTGRRDQLQDADKELAALRDKGGG